MVSMSGEVGGNPTDSSSKESMHGKEKRVSSYPHEQVARNQSIQYRITSPPLSTSPLSTTTTTATTTAATATKLKPSTSITPQSSSPSSSSCSCSPPHENPPVVSETVNQAATTCTNHHYQEEEEEDLGLYDVVANYSVGEIVEMHEKKRQTARRKPTVTSVNAKGRTLQTDLKKREKERREYSPAHSIQEATKNPEPQTSLLENPNLERESRPEWSSQRREHALLQKHRGKEDERKTLTIRRMDVLKKLYLDTLRDGDDFQYLKCMIAKLAGDEHGQLYLPSYENTPEDLSKLRAYLQSLDMTFEQIDEFLGDEFQ